MMRNIQNIYKLQKHLPLLNKSKAIQCPRRQCTSAAVSQSLVGLHLAGFTHQRTHNMKSVQAKLLQQDHFVQRCGINRRMSTTTATSSDDSSTKESNTKNKDSKTKNEKKDDDANIFLDNLGKIFIGIIASIILALIRSSRGNTNRTNLRDEMEKESLLDPLEIDDFRFANTEFKPEIFRLIMDKVLTSFPMGEASYTEFVSVVLNTMRELKGEQFTIEFGHYLDRVVIGYFEAQRNKHEGKGATMFTEPLKEKLPLSFLFTVLSLALNGPISERIQILFDVLTYSSNDKQINDSVGQEEVTESSIENIIEYLQLSCQLPTDPQILTADVKYPFQEYKVGVPEELLAFAKKEVSDKGDIILLGKESFNFNDFEAILHSTYICAWGQCYGRKK